MSKIYIVKENNNSFIKVEEKLLEFSYDLLNIIINENGLPIQITTLGLTGSEVHSISNYISSKDLDVKSFRAPKDKRNKYVIRVKEKLREKSI